MSESVAVQWFPGHMAKTRRLITDSLKQVDLVVELTDARIPQSSRNPELDQWVSGKPRILMLNKSDQADPEATRRWLEHYRREGIPALSCDCKSGAGVDRFLPMVRQTLAGLLARREEKGMAGRMIRIMVVGVPNVGKSSIVNKLLGENRVIVSDIAGTTRDAIDTEICWQDREYVLIDTAGLRRKNKIKEEIERFSIIRAVTAVERSDVAVLVIDATEGVTEQDAKIAGIAHDRGKGVIIAVNKWDAIEKNDKTIYEHTNRIREILSFMPYAELLFLSAKTGQRIHKLFDMIDVVLANSAMRIQTGVLNEIVTEAVAMQQPPSDKGKRLRIYYVTQVSVKPPTFVIFVNDKELMHFSYTRYLENRIRDAFGFQGTSLRFIVRERKEG